MALVWRRAGDLEVHYATFVISDGGQNVWPGMNEDMDDVIADQELVENGFVVHDDISTIIRTGIHTGPVQIAIELHDTRPNPQLDHWQEVAEFNAQTEFGDLRLAAFDDFPDWGLISTAGAGDYGIRVHAAGRDTGADETIDGPIERYLILAWPGPSTATDDEVVILKATDRVGAERRETGS